jgi:hypothetical protein
MAAIVWHETGSKFYEAGLDRAVLYVEDKTGVPWNGLISVSEKSDTKVESVYFNATKFNDIVTLGDYSGSISAYTYPDEFLECEGIVEDQQGLYLTDQPIKRFHICYRTLIGEDDNNHNSGYKIHILYNLTATPSTKVRRTLALNSEPNDFSWDVTSIPEIIEGHRPSSHLIIDSRKIDPWLLLDIEDILYGDNDSDPHLPPMKSLTTFIRKWDRLIIVDNGDETWSAISAREGIINEITPTEYTIESDDVVYLNATTYTISSSNKNEEDI